MSQTVSGVVPMTNDERLRLAALAAMEIEALAMATIDRVNADASGCDLSVRGMAVRMRELSGAIMCAVSFDDAAEGLADRVCGLAT